MTLPVFVPSIDSLNPLSNVIGTATATMFILSFPSSLLAIPLSFVISILFRIDTDAIDGQYLGVCLMFALGAIQWFWLVPAVWRRRTEANIQLPRPVDSPILTEGIAEFSSAAQTPLEKILDE
jgi:hypothetical protein